MTTQNRALEAALLVHGLEDLIPMWEAVTDPDVVAATNSRGRKREVAATLVALAEAGRISFYLGPWNEEPRRISPTRGAELVNEPRWFNADTEPDDLRLHVVNVENIADE